MTIIAMPLDVSKYFRNSMGSPFSASANAPGFDRDRLTGKDQAEDLAEDQFFDQQCDSEREGHSCDDCDSCDCELHNVLRSTFFVLYCPSPANVAAAGCAWASSWVTGAPPKISATSSSRSARIRTMSPTLTMRKSCSMSRFRSRMHPCEAALPIDLGSFVP